MLLKTTPDGTEIADFQFGFTLDQKAVVSEPADDGSIIIEGLAADFDVDRQHEAFEQGAFEEGLKSYMESNPILLYHHKPDTALGQVISANLTSEGLHVKARVDAPEPGTQVADYFRKIKNGTLRAFSVGGKFYRHMTENGPRIFKADLGEISITPYAINPRTLFSVAGKAFETVDESEPTYAERVLMDEFEARLARIDEALGEGKAKSSGGSGEDNPATRVVRARGLGQGHPDRAPVAALLMHMQKIHTLAENTAQNANDPEVAKVANDAVRSAQKHSEHLHKIAARIGPLPDYYGGLA